MRITESLRVRSSPARLFALSQDYSRRLEWDSYLCEARLVNAEVASVGVDSYCKSRGGSVMISRYISFSPPTHAAVEMIKGPWLLRQFGGTWRFRQAEIETTEVLFIYNFKVRPHLLRWVLEPIAAALYRRDMRHRLRAFQRWAESAA
jgi:ribosome-associated toxin RatA of RatAB toxin-antitoxin module